MTESSTTHLPIYKEKRIPKLVSHSPFFNSIQRGERKGERMESQKQERGEKKMKTITKIIALASIFSFVLSYSSLISSLQQRLHLLSMYFSLVDKKYMFLLCNGIVGFIMGNFETLLYGNAINIVEETEELRINDMRKSEMKKVVALGEKCVSKEEEEEEEEEERVDLLRGGEEVTLVVEDDNEGILVQDLAIIRKDDDDGDDDDDDDNDDEINDSFLSSEDLNKRCEDFIKKVKAEIRFESRKLITF